MKIETLMHQLPSTIPDGVILHGTSFHRSQSISQHGFDSSMASGDTLDEFNSHFVYFNPDPNQFRRETIGVLKREVGSLLGYAKHSTRTDLFEGKNYPVIIVARKPETITLDEREEKISRCVPIWISTNKLVKPETIGVIKLKDIPLNSHETDKQECSTLKKIWHLLEDKSAL